MDTTTTGRASFATHTLADEVIALRGYPQLKSVAALIVCSTNLGLIVPRNPHRRLPRYPRRAVLRVGLVEKGDRAPHVRGETIGSADCAFHTIVLSGVPPSSQEEPVLEHSAPTDYRTVHHVNLT